MLVSSGKLFAAGAMVLDLDDYAEASQLTSHASKRRIGAVARLVRRNIANATAGGITLTVEDLASFSDLLDHAHELAAKAHEAAMSVALARLEGVR